MNGTLGGMLVGTTLLPGHAAPLNATDPGNQYVSIRYTERLAEAGIEPSVGDTHDNALAETVIGLFMTAAICWRGPGGRICYPRMGRLVQPSPPA
jgi:hypothetical protein